MHSERDRRRIRVMRRPASSSLPRASDLDLRPVAARGEGSASLSPQLPADAVDPSAQPTDDAGPNVPPHSESLAPGGRDQGTHAGPVGLSGQLWTEEEQRLADANARRQRLLDVFPFGSLGRPHAYDKPAAVYPCVVCGFPVPDHSEPHAQQCYRMARRRAW